MGKRGRKKRIPRSQLPPEFAKFSPFLFDWKQSLPGDTVWTYMLVTALSWDDRGCDWTDEALAEKLGVSTRVVKKHVALLKRIGLLESHTISSKADGSSEGGRLLVPKPPHPNPSVQGPPGITGNARSRITGNGHSREFPFPQIPRAEDNTRVDPETGGGGPISIPGLDLKNNNNTREETTPPPSLSSWEEGGPGGEGEKTGNARSLQMNYRERTFPRIHPAFTTLAGIIGLTTPASVALMARIASEHHVGPRRLLALWRNVQDSGGAQGAFVHRLKNGIEPKLLPEPDHETPGFCPVCGAEISMRYGVGACPNGHELRVCDVCGELAPADGPCPWCGARPEEDEDEDVETEFQEVNA